MDNQGACPTSKRYGDKRTGRDWAMHEESPSHAGRVTDGVQDGTETGAPCWGHGRLQASGTASEIEFRTATSRLRLLPGSVRPTLGPTGSDLVEARRFEARDVLRREELDCRRPGVRACRRGRPVVQEGVPMMATLVTAVHRRRERCRGRRVHCAMLASKSGF